MIQGGDFTDHPANKPTVALCMIVKDEDIMEMVTGAYGFFDQLIFVVSDQTTATKMKKFFAKWDKINITHRPWNNKFDEARNFAQSFVTTDYWFWIDADDVFDFRAIPKIVEVAAEGNYDQILLPYNYAQDETGKCVAFHWRERLLKTSHPFYWKGWVHETPITQSVYTAHRINVEVRHNAGPDHVLESVERNHKILLAASKESDDPRYKLYLGTSHHARGEYGEAIVVLDDYLQVSGSAEDSYRALCCMSECAWLCQHPNKALDYASKAAILIPEHPQAYFLLAQWESEQENWKEALEWIKVSETKPDPTDLSVFDPTARHRAWLIAAQGEFMMKNFNEGLRWLRKVPADNHNRIDLEDDFISEADAETFVSMLPKMRKFFESDKALYSALCYALQYDQRLRGLRETVTDPKEWSAKSLVILCGQGYEEWGPQTLDKGMGGSEEAVVYLSREMAKLGWEVTIYGAVEKELVDSPTMSSDKVEEYTKDLPTPYKAPVYLPWQELDRRDKFNVFVGWRAPGFSELINAKVKICDIHDALPPTEIKDYDDVTYFVKTNFHRGLYPALPDNKFKVIGNGIKKGQF